MDKSMRKILTKLYYQVAKKELNIDLINPEILKFYPMSIFSKIFNTKLSEILSVFKLLSLGQYLG